MSWPTPGCQRLIDAMVHAEGGEQAFVRAVRCSMKCEDYAEARRIAANTIAHALWDWAMSPHDGRPAQKEPQADPGFVKFLGDRWAPVPLPGEPPLANDPTGLNKNWVPNVLDHLGMA